MLLLFLFWCVIWCFFIWNLPTTSTALSYINCCKSSNVVALSFVSLCCKCCWYLFRNVSEIIFYGILFSLLILAISFCIFIVIVVWSVLFITFSSQYSLLKKWSFPLRISSVNVDWSHLLKKSLMENFIFCAVTLLHLLQSYLYFCRGCCYCTS